MVKRGREDVDVGGVAKKEKVVEMPKEMTPDEWAKKRQVSTRVFVWVDIVWGGQWC